MDHVIVVLALWTVIGIFGMLVIETSIDSAWRWFIVYLTVAFGMDVDDWIATVRRGRFSTKFSMFDNNQKRAEQIALLEQANR
jgi:hypothetical protein